MVLLHKSIEFEEDVVDAINDAQQGRVQRVHAIDSYGPTFVVVLLHVVNALAAASIASFVLDRPISGIVPSSSLVAGEWEGRLPT